MTVSHDRRFRRTAGLAMAGVIALGVTAVPLVIEPIDANAAEAPVGLGTAADFSVLAGSTVTNTGASFLAQSLGVHPGNTAPGFPPGSVGGEVHLGDGVALQAKSDLTTAFNDAAGRTPFTNLAAELGGTTLNPGVYRIGAAEVTGQLRLNAQGDSQAVFIFQVDSTLVTASNSSVVFINGASPCNVYWKIGSSATLGTGTTFIGNIMAQASITMATGATLQGRALARTGAVTLDDNVITQPLCTPTPSPTPTEPSPTPTEPSPTPTEPSPTPTEPSPTPTEPSPTPTEPSPTPTPTVSPSPSPTPTTSRTPTRSPTPSPTSTDDDLPDTGGGQSAALVSSGILLTVLGGVMYLVRRRTRES